MVSTNFLYGLEYGSYVWAGSGLFPQAVSCHFLLLAIGFGFRAICQGRRPLLPGVLLACTFLSHFIYGYIGALCLCLLTLLPESDTTLGTRVARMFRIAGVSFFASAFALIPLFQDGGIINHSRWELSWKWDSFGAFQVLKWLFTGELLDHGRLPVLSLLALAGIVLLCWQWRRGRVPPARLFLLAGAALWILMFFGRPFWGTSLALLGALPDMQLHRVIGGVHVFLVLVAGVGLAKLWEFLAVRRQVLIAALVTLGLLYPMARERYQFLSNNRTWGQRNSAVVAGYRNYLDAAIEDIKQHGGRAYPGLAAGWGGKFKVGDVPMYAFLSQGQVPAVAFLYHSMALTSDVEVHFNEWSPAQYRLFNIRTLIAPNGTALPPFLKPRNQIGPFQLFDTPGSGYFDVVDVPAAIRITRHNFYDVNSRWLQSAWPTNRQYLWLDLSGESPDTVERLAADSQLPQPTTNPSPGSVSSEQETDNSYEAQVNVAHPSFALFKMTWHRNWKAYVDGRPERTVMLSPGFVGIPVSPGLHSIRCSYEPGPWKPIMAIGGMILAIVFGSTKFQPDLPKVITHDIGRKLGFAALVLPVCVSLFTAGVPAGHDALAYLPRLVEFHQNISQGIFFPQWAPDLVFGAGEPLFEFCPPMIYYLAESWHLIGFDFVTAINLACVSLVLASAAGMFLLGKLYFGEWGGWLAAAACLYAPYFSVDLYVRSALAEFTAFPFFAFSLYGFGAFATRGERGYLLLGALAYAGILCSHNAAALVFTPLLLAFFLFSAHRARSWSVLGNQISGWLIGLGLAALVWVPALLERTYVGLERTLAGYFHYSNHFVYLHQLLYSPWGYGISVPGDQDGMSFAIGWSHLLLVLLAWVGALLYSKHSDRRWLCFFTAATAVFCSLMLPRAAWFWRHATLLQYLQFPWRMLGLVSTCVALLVASLGPVLRALPRWRSTAFGVVMCLLVIPNLSHNQPLLFHDEDLSLWTPQHLASRGIEVTSASEYVPRWVKVWPTYDPHMIHFVGGNADVQQTVHKVASWAGAIRSEQALTAELSIAWFPGWQVRIDDKPVTTSPAESTGLIRFEIPAGTHRVEAVWERTNPRRLGAAISLLSLFAVVVICWLEARRRDASPKMVAVASSPGASYRPPN